MDYALVGLGDGCIRSRSECLVEAKTTDVVYQKSEQRGTATRRLCYMRGGDIVV